MSAEVAMNASPIEQLIPAVNHVIKSLDPKSIFLSEGAYPVRMAWNDVTISTYTVFFAIHIAMFIAIVFMARKQMALVPKGRFINMFESLFEFVRNNIAGSAIHHERSRYVPFLATMFIFILISNLTGLIPGTKSGATGTISGTLALSMIVFVYFTYHGIRVKGGWGYIKALVPKGLPKAIVPLIFVIELASVILRPVTQALRLFANMYAGHIVLGIFAVATELFFMAGFQGGSWLNMAASPVWLALIVAMYALEVLVCLIQAYVFTLLTAVYIESATGEH